MLKANILIVDDSELSREILLSMLGEEYNLYEAGNGRVALEMLEERPEFYQLVLLDLNMPEIDGYGVLKVMKERGWLDELPVIIISAEIGEANKLGVVDFISKPFDREIVRTRIKNVLAIYERYVTDSLTGGLNRKGFIRQVENLFRSGVDQTQYEILFFDIKNFKAINELIGIENGDRVLRQFYHKLAGADFEPLAAARIESDHFACLAKRKDDSYAHLDKLCEQRFEQGGKQFQIRVHCGIYQVEQGDKITAAGMLERAILAGNSSNDYAKYYAVYTSEMKTRYMDRTEISTDLEKSLKQREFKVYYQPIMDSHTGKIVSAEALVRWQHPEKGIVSPAVFIPALEKDGTISQLDMYVLQTVRRFQKERYQAGTFVVPVSVNLSGIDFYDQRMMDEILGFLDSDELPSWLTRFEITESSYAVMEEQCISRIREFRKHDVRILMDDFGTGYSSLGLLRNSDVDILKLDMNFIRRINQDAKTRCILRSIIDMAHQLKLKVVAEGVENAAQLAFLQRYECDYIQGYYYSKPLPEEEFADFLANARPFDYVDDIDKTSEFVPYFYRAGVHYISKQVQKNAKTDRNVISRMLANNHAVGTISGFFDKNYTICYVCDYTLNLFGMSFEVLRNYTRDSYLCLVAPEDREGFKTHREGIFEYHLLLPDGKRLRIRDSKAIVYAMDGQEQWISSIHLLEDN